MEEKARKLIRRLKDKQLADIRSRMDDDRQGVEVEYGGRKYVAYIRRLTPAECARLQTIPEWYDFSGVSDSGVYFATGNGWNVETIKHCFSFMPEFGRPVRVWSLFDGMACCAIALKELGIPVEVYVSSEVEKNDLALERSNFPDIVQVGDVTKMDVADLVAKYGVPDLVTAGSPCFVAGTKVLTLEGYKNIEDVNVGDMVLTHNNRYRKVLNVGGHEDDVYRLHAQGFIDVICTANHPFYARKKSFEKYIKADGKPSKKLNLGEPEWIRADELAQNYYIANNIESQESENPLGITEEEAWVIGRYIADGHTRKDVRYDGSHNGTRYWQVILSIGNDKLEQFRSHFKKLHYSAYPHGESVHRVVFSSRRLVEIVESECGVGSINKHFGETLIRLPKHLLEIVLKGFLEGDGNYRIKERSYSITTISEMLAITMQRVVSKLYGKHITISRHIPAEYRGLCGRMVHQNPQYIVRFADHDLRTQERPKLIGDKIWQNTKSFTPAGREMVYNLEVEEDNSYTANNIIVHNCQSFSFSGKMKGMSTATGEEIYTLDRYLELKKEGFQFEGQSYLFWEFMRILEEARAYNPDVLFFLENVKMLEKWERCLSHAVGVRGVHINSALVSAQSRQRIYWTNFRVKSVGQAKLFDFSDDPFEWPDLAVDIPQPEDRGIVIKDILDDTVDGKYYLKDHVVRRLMDNTDMKRLSGYLREPQMSEEELLAYMEGDPEYTGMGAADREALARLACSLERADLEGSFEAVPEGCWAEEDGDEDE
jgi:site-specific DNA-cytosine methylase/intein/homing endonuclease